LESVEKLEWDSEFFGISIARLRSVGQPIAALSTQLRALKRQDYRLVYWLSPTLELPSDRELTELGGVLVDLRATYSRECVQASGGEIAHNSKVEALERVIVTPALRSLALQAGVYSRFRKDPRIGRNNFEALYTRWIESSVSGDFADAVFVARSSGVEVAMITVRCRERIGSIGLFAVDPSQQKQGLGAELLNAALEYFCLHGCDIAEVVTQLENRAACRLYEHCGYSLKKVERVYHFWL